QAPGHPPLVGRHFFGRPPRPGGFTGVPAAARKPEPAARRGQEGREFMRIVTWNINSVRLRLANIDRLTRLLQPDVMCLQETKVQDPDFPHEALDAYGYKYRAVRGMKNYNGVAVLSRLPFTANG